MADFPTETRHLEAADGTRIAWHEGGAGRPVVLIHGYFSNADTNWVRFGHAARIAARGFRVILPDLRGHGASGAPHGDAAYPPDVLADDNLALIRHLGLQDYDLGGYSLGARTTVRMLVKGAAPDRVVLSGMGLEGLLDTGKRAAHFRRILTGLGSFARGSPEFMVEAFLKTTGADPQALLGVLASFVDSTRDELSALGRPTLVLAGDEDEDNGSHDALAALLPDAQLQTVPGGHMSVVTRPAFGEAIAEFLAR